MRTLVDSADETHAPKFPALAVTPSGARVAVVPAIVTVAMFLAVTLFLAARLNIWQDEAYSLHTSSLGVWNALRQGVAFEAQAPLYFGLLALWRAPNDSLLAARTLSIALSLTALYFTWRFARRYIVGVAPTVVLAAVAFNPFAIWAAVEVRPYAAAVAISAALVYTFFRGWIDEEASVRARVAFVVLAIVGAYTQYYIATLVPAAGCAVLFSSRPKRLLSFVLAGCVIAVALVPIVYLLPLQLSSYRALGAVSPLPAYAIVLALSDYLYPHAWIGSWAHAPRENGTYFLLAVIPLGLALRFVERPSGNARVLLALVAVVSAIFAAFIGVAHAPVLFPRHTAVLFVPVLLAAFAVIASVTRKRRTVALATFGIVYASFAALSLWSTYHGLAKNGDWLRVGAFLTSSVSPHDTVAVFNTEARLPLAYYFRALPLQAIPRPQSFAQFDEAEFVLNDESEVAKILGRAAAHRSRVWLVVNNVCTTRPAFYGCAYLERYVARHFHVVRVVKFIGSSITELTPIRAI